MNRIGKLFISVLLVIGLLTFVMIPAFGYTVNYWTNRTQYSTGNNYYTPGSYSTKYGSYKPVTPTQPVNPTQPPVTPRPTPPPPPPAPKPGGSLSAEESKMVNLVNQERMNQGVRPLGVNQQLVNLARKKSQDMVDKNYFGHTSPTYGSPFDMMNSAGIKYRTAGENIAGAANTESAHQNLMNSPGHRANILNPSFTELGIGIAPGSIYGNIFTQIFIGN
jgi:uncharacterized YkwD family protein